MHLKWYLWTIDCRTQTSKRKEAEWETCCGNQQGIDGSAAGKGPVGWQNGQGDWKHDSQGIIEGRLLCIT